MTRADVTQPRLHALDAIRAAALLLGICLHATLSFIPGLGAALWPVSDSEKSTSLAFLMFFIHIFRMSVFFLVAGLLAHFLFHRLGLRGFCRNRAQRIVAPLVLGWVVCFTAIAAVVLWALARTHGGQLPDPLPDGLAETGLNFLHLWFLYLLLWLYAIAIAGRFAWHAIDTNGVMASVAERALRASLASHAGPLLLAAPVAVALFLSPDWVVGWGVPTPAYTLVPPAAPLFIYAWIFGIGWLLDRQRGLLDELAARWPFNGALGLTAALAVLFLTGSDINLPAWRPSSMKLAQAAAYGIALIGWTLAFTGAGVRYFNRARPVVRYVADASYWMYLMHLPLVMALQTLLMQAHWHWSIKFALINALSFLILLASYHVAVRPTWVGLLLNGRRVPRGARSDRA